VPLTVSWQLLITSSALAGSSLAMNTATSEQAGSGIAATPIWKLPPHLSAGDTATTVC
jgi:hypothetical protein